MLAYRWESLIFVYIMVVMYASVNGKRYKNEMRLNPWRSLRSKTIMNENIFNVEEKGETI